MLKQHSYTSFCGLLSWVAACAAMTKTWEDFNF